MKPEPIWDASAFWSASPYADNMAGELFHHFVSLLRAEDGASNGTADRTKDLVQRIKPWMFRFWVCGHLGHPSLHARSFADDFFVREVRCVRLAGGEAQVVWKQDGKTGPSQAVRPQHLRRLRDLTRTAAEVVAFEGWCEPERSSGDARFYRTEFEASEAFHRIRDGLSRAEGGQAVELGAREVYHLRRLCTLSVGRVWQAGAQDDRGKARKVGPETLLVRVVTYPAARDDWSQRLEDPEAVGMVLESLFRSVYWRRRAKTDPPRLVAGFQVHHALIPTAVIYLDLPLDDDIGDQGALEEDLKRLIAAPVMEGGMLTRLKYRWTYHAWEHLQRVRQPLPYRFDPKALEKLQGRLAPALEAAGTPRWMHVIEAQKLAVFLSLLWADWDTLVAAEKAASSDAGGRDPAFRVLARRDAPRPKSQRPTTVEVKFPWLIPGKAGGDHEVSVRVALDAKHILPWLGHRRREKVEAEWDPARIAGLLAWRLEDLFVLVRESPLVRPPALRVLRPDQWEDLNAPRLEGDGESAWLHNFEGHLDTVRTQPASFEAAVGELERLARESGIPVVELVDVERVEQITCGQPHGRFPECGPCTAFALTSQARELPRALSTYATTFVSAHRSEETGTKGKSVEVSVRERNELQDYSWRFVNPSLAFAVLREMLRNALERSRASDPIAAHVGWTEARAGEEEGQAALALAVANIPAPVGESVTRHGGRGVTALLWEAPGWPRSYRVYAVKDGQIDLCAGPRTSFAADLPQRLADAADDLGKTQAAELAARLPHSEGSKVVVQMAVLVQPEAHA